ncbi:MAG: hypothetical protein D5R98_03840 [Desulfonatronovibrio sp. MSAO_Bac4]|nr:MAG: hypothetical protein D5R98_03840 [Desulfonatronovibrio sp. MSAO_Bac4]
MLTVIHSSSGFIVKNVTTLFMTEIRKIKTLARWFWERLGAEGALLNLIAAKISLDCSTITGCPRSRTQPRTEC